MTRFTRHSTLPGGHYTPGPPTPRSSPSPPPPKPKTKATKKRKGSSHYTARKGPCRAMRCLHCNATEAVAKEWRTQGLTKEEDFAGKRVCNAWGQYFKTHQVHRPAEFWRHLPVDERIWNNSGCSLAPPIRIASPPPVGMLPTPPPSAPVSSLPLPPVRDVKEQKPPIVHPPLTLKIRRANPPTYQSEDVSAIPAVEEEAAMILLGISNSPPTIKPALPVTKTLPAPVQTRWQLAPRWDQFPPQRPPLPPTPSPEWMLPRTPISPAYSTCPSAYHFSRSGV